MGTGTEPNNADADLLAQMQNALQIEQEGSGERTIPINKPSASALGSDPLKYFLIVSHKLCLLEKGHKDR